MALALTALSSGLNIVLFEIIMLTSSSSLLQFVFRGKKRETPGHPEISLLWILIFFVVIATFSLESASFRHVYTSL
jgi:hypothetical protein